MRTYGPAGPRMGLRVLGVGAVGLAGPPGLWLLCSLDYGSARAVTVSVLASLSPAAARAASAAA